MITSIQKPQRLVEIHTDYIDSVSGVRAWIVDYCKRNKIWLSEVAFQPGQLPRFKLVFKSLHQMLDFQRRGNDKYPYFEFL